MNNQSFWGICARRKVVIPVFLRGIKEYIWGQDSQIQLSEVHMVNKGIENSLVIGHIPVKHHQGHDVLERRNEGFQNARILSMISEENKSIIAGASNNAMFFF